MNLQTGILPVNTVQLDPAHTKALENLTLSAEISPVLGSPGRVGLPALPVTEENQTYAWHVPDGEGYVRSEAFPPLVSFDETILMDGFIIKGTE